MLSAMTRSARSVPHRPAGGNPTPATAGTRPVHTANRLGLDYAAEANLLGPPVAPIVDAHSHIGGGEITRLYADAARRFGIETE